MDTTNIKEFLTLHEEFVRRVQETVAVVRAGEEKERIPKGAIDRDRVVKQFQKRIESLSAAKQRAIERLDAEIRRHQETLASLGGTAPLPKAADDRPAGPESRTEDRKARSTKPRKKAGGKG